MNINPKIEDEEEFSKKEITIFVSFSFNNESNSRIAHFIKIDYQKLDFQWCKFYENEFYGNSESLFIQWGLIEQNSHIDFSILLARSPNISRDNQKIDVLFSSIGCKIVDISSSYYKTASSQENTYEMLFKNTESIKISRNDENAKIVLFLVSYLQLWNNNFFLHKFTFSEYIASSFLKIDMAAIRALSIYNNDIGSKASGNTIYGHICSFIASKMAERTLKQWLFQPLQSKVEINYRTTTVRTYIQNIDVRRQIKKLLKKMPDIDKIITRLFRLKYNRRNNTGLADCYKLYTALKMVNSCVLDFESVCRYEQDFNLLNMLKSIDDGYVKFYKMIEEALDFERIEQTGECFINPLCSKELLRIKNAMDEKEKLIEKLRVQLQTNLGNVNLISQQKVGLLFEANKEKAINFFRSSEKRFSISTTRKTTLTFTCKELTALASEIEQLKVLYAKEQSSYIVEVIESTTEYIPLLEATNIILIEQDILSGFAEMYVNSGQNNVYCLGEYVDSDNSDEQLIELKDSWHICVKNCIPNDIILDSSSQSALILTGPNMGGKSTYIRQIAICVLLAHVGCPVPAFSCRFTQFSSIYTRVGANDIQQKGISTFMNEMIETATMLSSANSKSLLIIDELGRGTSIIEGRALAQAIFEDIILKKRCFCLFATHFFELTKLSLQYPMIKNCSMKVYERTGELLFTYKVANGAIGKSFGISLINSMDFPKEIVENAFKICQKLENS